MWYENDEKLTFFLKGESLCHVEIEQGLLVKGPAQAVVWVEAKAKVGAEWVDHLLQDRVDNASVSSVAKGIRT